MTYRIEFAILAKITTTANRIGGDGSSVLSTPVPPGWDKITLYGRAAYVDASTFSITLYSDYERTTSFKSGTGTYAALPGSVSLGGGWSVHAGVFGPLDVDTFFDFTWFGGTDPQVGLTQGCFALVTGTPGYDGTVPLFHYDEATGTVLDGGPVNPNTFQEITKWGQGIIAADGLGTPATEVEFSDGGSYGVMSGGDIKFVNAWPTQVDPGGAYQTVTSFLQERGLDFVKAEIQTFIVIDDVFYPSSLTFGSNPVFDDVFYTEPTEDPHAFIHGKTAKETLSKNTYRTLPPDNEGKVMPLSIGYSLAELVPLSSATNTTPLARAGAKDLTMTRATAASGLTLTLYTPGLATPFTTNDPRLVGKQIAVALAGISGDTFFSPFIKSNAATAVNLTVVTMTDGFRKKDNTPVTPLFGTDKNTWWFIVYDFTDFEAVSEGAIHGFLPGPSSSEPPVLGWDDTNSRFFTLQHRLITAFPSGGYPPYPTPAGLLLKPASDTLVPQVNRRPLVLTGATNSVTSPAPATLPVSGGDDVVYSKIVDTFPTGGTSGQLLFNQQRGAGYTRTWQITTKGLSSSSPFDFIYNSGSAAPVAAFNMDLPPNFVLGDDERLTIAMDSDVVLASQGSDQASYEVSMKLVLLDEFGVELISGILRRSGARAAPISPLPTPSGTTYQTRNIGNEYYGEAPTAWQIFEVDVDGGGDIETVLRQASYRKIVRFRIYLYVTFRVHFNNPNVGPVNYNCGYTIYQVALVSTNPDTYTGTKYVKQIGVDFGTGWGTRTPPRVATDPVLAPGDAIEYLIRKQDLRPEFVDTAAFDAFSFFRAPPTWFVGNQLRDSDDNFARIQSMAEGFFFCVVPGKNGARQPRIIERYQDASAHPETRLIFSDVIDRSMGPAETSMLDRLYTSVDFQYDQNPASGDYNCRMRTLNEEFSTFPAIDAMIPDSDPPVPVWTTWVTGLSAFDANGNIIYSGAIYESVYAAALDLWSRGRAAYLRCGQKNPYQKDLPWMRQKKDWYPGVQSSTEDGAFSLALLVADYLFVQWVYQALSVPITPATARLNLMDRAGYGDPIRTDGRLFDALVKRIEVDTSGLIFNLILGRRVTDSPFGMIEVPPDEIPVWQDTLAGGAEEFDDQLYDGVNPIIQDT